MEVKLEEYVYGGCTIEERNAVRGYIMEDFYNAFDVIEMMRDRAYEELAPRTHHVKKHSGFEVSNMDYDICEDTYIMPSITPSISHGASFSYTAMNKSKPKSIIEALNLYLAKE